MIDHTGLFASDYDRSKRFFLAALAPIGYAVLVEFPADATGLGSPQIAGFGEPPRPDFWVIAGEPNKPPLHIAFRVSTRAAVDAFYKAAIAAGGRDNGVPGLRPHYHPDYYGAYVLDPDGHNIEAVCHEAE